MNAMIVFLVAFFLVGVFPILLRSKGATVFMMLCVGRALMEVSSDEMSVAARMVLNSDLPVDDIAKVFLMLSPAVLTVFLTRKAAKKKFVYHIVPAVVSGLLAGFWSVQLLSVSDTFEFSSTFAYVQTNIAAILGVGIVSSLFLLLLERPKPVKPEDQDDQHKK